MSIPRRTRRTLAVAATWAATRCLLLLCVFKVLVLPGPDPTSDVHVIYQGWSQVLGTGTYPLDDVTWQYPPAAALAILSPAVLPFLDYATAFFVLALLADTLVFALLMYAAGRPGKCLNGAWMWTLGVPLLGPTAYARYDLMVTAVAVAALLAGARHPRTLGALAAFGALLKVWPALLLLRAPRRALITAAACATMLLAACVAAAPGAFAFLTFQRERGTEVESLGALVFHVARQFGWRGRVQLTYGSVEFLGPYVPLVSALALVLSLLALGWLVLWRVRSPGPWRPSTLADAAFTAVLLFTTTSRVISPQYLVWLVGLGAVCLVFRRGPMLRPAQLVLAATGVTCLEFPVWFAHVVASDWLGVLLLVVRNGLLVAACVLACRHLWRSASSVRAPLAVRAARTAAPSATR
ncbi:glycosyltransferase 87 family protein [Streptomyces sp. NPDC048416]|uniref:glycosyltransferase 87 family protein n=1 Tax=Streptomyces sp. NPDC048416 TaxID=3365546 RepID=UPI003712C14F